MLLVLRFTHVFFGALWVGMMAFQTFALMPSLVEAGPDGAKVMAAIVRRRIPIILPIFALLTLISGFWLMTRLMGGNTALMMRTSMGRAYSWGAAAATVAFLLGILVMRPAMMKSMRLAQSGDPAFAGEIQRLRARAGTMGRVVTVLLLITLALMAVARYLG